MRIFVVEIGAAPQQGPGRRRIARPPPPKGGSGPDEIILARCHGTVCSAFSFTFFIHSLKTYAMIQYVCRSMKSPRTGTYKYYVQIAPSTPILRRQIIEEIEKTTTLTSSDVKACLDALENAVVQHLAQGQAVRLGDLGSFRPTISSFGTTEPEKCDSTLIRRVRCRFTQSGTMGLRLQPSALNFQPYKTVTQKAPQA